MFQNSFQNVLDINLILQKLLEYSSTFIGKTFHHFYGIHILLKNILAFFLIFQQLLQYSGTLARIFRKHFNSGISSGVFQRYLQCSQNYQNVTEHFLEYSENNSNAPETSRKFQNSLQNVLELSQMLLKLVKLSGTNSRIFKKYHKCSRNSQNVRILQIVWKSYQQISKCELQCIGTILFVVNHNFRSDGRLTTNYNNFKI